MNKFNTCPDCKKFIAEGKCKADCCGIVPFEKHLFQQIKHKAYEKEFEQNEFKAKGQTFILPVAKDGICIFLNKKDYSCVIYNSPRKPDLCRQFGMSETEPLLACRHINPDLADRIDAEANRVFDDVKRKYEEIKKK